MIGKAPEGEDAGASIRQGAAKRLGTADAAEGCDWARAQRFQCRPLLLAVDQFDRLMTRLNDRRMRRRSPDLVTQSFAFAGADLIAARQDDDAGAAEAARRLAQQAARKVMPMAPGAGRVKKDNIQVARQSSMLEAVVEHQDLAPELLDCRPGKGDTVSPLQV